DVQADSRVAADQGVGAGNGVHLSAGPVDGVVGGLAVGRAGQRALQVGVAGPGDRRGEGGGARGGGGGGPAAGGPGGGAGGAGRAVRGEQRFTGDRVGVAAEGLGVGQAVGLQPGQPQRQDAQDHRGGDPDQPRPGRDGPADPRPQPAGGRLG